MVFWHDTDLSPRFWSSLTKNKIPQNKIPTVDSPTLFLPPYFCYMISLPFSHTIPIQCLMHEGYVNVITPPWIWFFYVG